MKLMSVLFSVGCLVSAAVAGLSGTYTIRPDGSGDFPSLESVQWALYLEGMSGDCSFLLDSADYSNDVFWLDFMQAGDEYLLTFRPAAGERVTIDAEDWRCAGRHLPRVELESLEFGVRCVVTYGVEDQHVVVRGCNVLNKLVLHGGAGHIVCGNRIAYLHLQFTTSAVVANNALMDTDINPLWGALVVEDSEESTQVYYNTFYRSAGSAPVSGCWATGYGLDLRNNAYVVLYDSAFAALVCEPSRVPLSVSDYNCYWTSPPVPVAMDDVGGGRYGFSAWQALGYDGNGLSADPLLAGPLDPHLLEGSPCIGAGTPIPGFDSDIDGDPRDPDHPCIGADEFTIGAVEEVPKPQVSSHKLQATVIRSLPRGTVAFDAMGRRVLNPKPGVYFVRDAHAQAQAQAQAMRKVIVQR